MSYVNLAQLGSNSNTPNTNPLAYCSVSGLDQMFNFGSYLPNVNTSTQCQLYTAGYCANNWDGTCEYMSQNAQIALPSVMGGTSQVSQLSLGESLVRQTAMNKYLVSVSSNGERRYEPFDPTVPTSPMVSKWMSTDGQPVLFKYAVNPDTIDSDPVMNKIIQNPTIATDILINIYNNAIKTGTLNKLSNTKLGQLFMSNWFKQQNALPQSLKTTMKGVYQFS